MKRIEIDPEPTASLREQKKAFRAKFGREPGPGDPMFFNPDSDEPEFLTEMQRKDMTDEIYRIILMAGIDPAYAYAFRKTGRLLTEENMKYLSPAELAEWIDAIEEYQFVKRPVQ